MILENLTIKKIEDVISSIKPCDHTEKQDIRDALAWIKSGISIFRIQKPNIPNKHLASYFVLFDEQNHKILLVDHKKAGLWLPAGGHVEINEDPKETVRRECLEELGINADFYFPDPIFLTLNLISPQPSEHIDVNLWYVLKGNSNILYEFDQTEFNTVDWFNLDSIVYEKSEKNMKRFIDKLKKQLKNKD